MARILGFLLVLFLTCPPSWAQPDTLWTRTYGGPGNDLPVSIVPASDGGYLLFGRIATCDTCVTIMKINEDGDEEWTRLQTASRRTAAVKMIALSEGGYACLYNTSHSVNSPTPNEDVWIVGLDDSLNMAWDRTIRGRNSSPYYPIFAARQIVQTSYGFAVLCWHQTVNGAAPTNRAVVIGLGADGDSLWSVNAMGADNIGSHMAITDMTIVDGVVSDVIAIGYLSYCISHWPGPSECHSGSYVYRVREWSSSPASSRLYDDTGGGTAITSSASDRIEFLHSLTADSTTFSASDTIPELLCSQRLAGRLTALRPFGGGFLAAGTIHTDSTNLVLKGLDQFGHEQFSRNWGGNLPEQFSSMALTPDGGCILAGTTTSFGASGVDVYVVKVGPIGPLAVEPAPSNTLPEDYALSAFPNPFNGTASIRYSLPSPANVSVELYNTLGQRVLALADGPQTAGSHALQVSSADLASGVYFVSLSVQGRRHFTKLLCLK